MKPYPQIVRLGAILVVWLAPVAAMSAEDSPGRMYGSVSVVHVSPLDSKLSGESWKADLVMDDSLGFLAAVGYDTGTRLRAELEIGYRKLDLEKLENQIDEGQPQPDEEAEGNWETLQLMLNGYYVFGQGRLKPYIGIGVGLARHEFGVDDADDLESDTVLAYQGIAGAAYRISDRTEARLGYRYVATGDYSYFEESEASYNTHNIEAGIVFRF